MTDAYIGTNDGIALLRDGTLEPLGLAGERVEAVHAFDGVVLAGTYEGGLRRREGDGEWERVEAGVTAACFRCIGPDPSRAGGLLAGTEPARLLRSDDGGQSWSELPGVAAIEGHDDWFLPYSPRAGALRNVHGAPGLLLASVEVGGLLRSEDGGDTWALAPIVEDEDIHFVTGHPSDSERMYAALGSATLTYRGADRGGRTFGGIARSRDRGRAWEKVEHDYTRAVLVPPARADLLLAAPAPRVGRDGRIVVSADDGDTWTEASDGIATPMPDMVELFVPAPDGSVWAICSGGRLLRAEPGEWRWEPALPAGAADHVRSVCFLPA
jgi:photosystem II stability/assembly factor-like uncharacterized protein